MFVAAGFLGRIGIHLHVRRGGIDYFSTLTAGLRFEADKMGEKNADWMNRSARRKQLELSMFQVCWLSSTIFSG